MTSSSDRSLTEEQRGGGDGASPAYPTLDHNPHIGLQLRDCGLTKRELFAAMAMQGVIASDSLHPDDNAAFAVQQADLLLKELAK